MLIRRPAELKDSDGTFEVVFLSTAPHDYRKTVGVWGPRAWDLGWFGVWVGLGFGFVWGLGWFLVLVGLGFVLVWGLLILIDSKLNRFRCC